MQSFLMFSLHEQLFAVDAMTVRESLWLPELKPLEGTSPYIVGAMNLRGKIVSVMDLDILCGHPRQKYRPADSVIILEREGALIGIIAHDIRDVIPIASEDIEPVPSPKRKDKPHHTFISGEAKVGENIVMILNKTVIMDLGLQISEIKGVKSEHTHFCPEGSPEEKAIFHERARNLMCLSEEQEVTGLIPLVVVSLNEEYFGIELNLVREFSGINNNFTPIPCCPGHIVGNMNLRGNIITLIDIRDFLNMPYGTLTASARVIVSQVEKITAGILVDGISDIIYLKLLDIGPIPSAIRKATGEFLKGTIVYGDRTVTVLNLAKILTSNKLVVNGEA